MRGLQTIAPRTAGADVSRALPYLYDAGNEDARARYRLTTDTCSWADQDYCLRGVLVVPIREAQLDLEFGVWTSVSPEDFNAYEGGEGTAVDPMIGWFASRVPGYPETLSLKVKAHPQPNGLRPLFELEPTAHPLARQHRDGISLVEAVAYLHEQFPGGW